MTDESELETRGNGRVEEPSERPAAEVSAVGSGASAPADGTADGTATGPTTGPTTGPVTGPAGGPTTAAAGAEPASHGEADGGTDGGTENATEGPCDEDGTAETAEPGRPPYFVQSLERGLAVVRAFDAGHPRLTLSDVARLTGLTRAAARRFLLTLADLGYVRFDGRWFALTPRVLQLGYSYLSSITLPEVAEPHLKALVAEVHESSSVSVLDDQDVVYIARVPTSRIMTVAINVGTRFPAYATSMGRVLLAGLPDDELESYLSHAELSQLTSHTVGSVADLRSELETVRTRGWALVDQELEDGLRSIAAPIRDREGRVVAAMNLSAQASRAPVAEIEDRLLPHLLATAARIEADLQNSPQQPRTHTR